MTTTNPTSYIHFTSNSMNTQRFARPVPKAEDFAPLERKSDKSKNFSRGRRRNSTRATRTIL